MFTSSGKAAAGQLVPRSRKTASLSKSFAAATALRIVEPDYRFFSAAMYGHLISTSPSGLEY